MRRSELDEKTKLGLQQDTSEASSPTVGYEGHGDTVSTAKESHQGDTTTEFQKVTESMPSIPSSFPSSVIGHEDLASLMLEPIADITIDPHSPDTDTDACNVAP
jgi:hypothetical protein